MHKIIIILLAFVLVGCAGDRFSQQLPVSRTVKLKTTNVWPLKTKGSYLQKITATVRGKQQTMSVHLTMNDYMLEAIAFNDVAGRLYRLKWTPEKVLWEGSAHIPAIIKPENVLADFLLAYLPDQTLQRSLKGACFFEKGDQFGKTRTIKDRNVLRAITYNKPLGGMWGHVVIRNPAIGYTLDIQTVVQ